MNKKQAFEIIQTALTNYVNDSAGKDSKETKQLQKAFTNLYLHNELLEHQLDYEKSENTMVKDFLYGGHFGNKYKDFPDSTLYIGTSFEVGGTYEDWGFVVKKWQGKDKGFKLIATHRHLKGVIEKAINRLNEKRNDK